MLKTALRHQFFRAGQSLVEDNVDFSSEWWFARDRLREFFVVRKLSGEFSGKTGIARLGYERPALRRKSDTVFILGSGPSINAITQKQWHEIATHDSIGVNFWMIHDFTPDILCIEAPHDPVVRRGMIANLELRRERYRHVPILVNYRHWHQHHVPDDWLAPITDLDLRLTLPVHFPTISPKLFSLQCALWRRLPRLFKRRHPIHHRSNLSLAVSLAASSPWRHIVLAGVDLDCTDYFWNVRPCSPRLFTPTPSAENNVHFTASSRVTRDYHSLPIQQVLTIFQRSIFTPRSQQIHLLNRFSRLAPHFPHYHMRC